MKASSEWRRIRLSDERPIGLRHIARSSCNATVLRPTRKFVDTVTAGRVREGRRVSTVDHRAEIGQLVVKSHTRQVGDCGAIVRRKSYASTHY